MCLNPTRLTTAHPTVTHPIPCLQASCANFLCVWGFFPCCRQPGPNLLTGNWAASKPLAGTHSTISCQFVACIVKVVKKNLQQLQQQVATCHTLSKLAIDVLCLLIILA